MRASNDSRSNLPMLYLFAFSAPMLGIHRHFASMPPQPVLRLLLPSHISDSSSPPHHTTSPNTRLLSRWECPCLAGHPMLSPDCFFIHPIVTASARRPPRLNKFVSHESHSGGARLLVLAISGTLGAMFMSALVWFHEWVHQGLLLPILVPSLSP